MSYLVFTHTNWDNECSNFAILHFQGRRCWVLDWLKSHFPINFHIFLEQEASLTSESTNIHMEEIFVKYLFKQGRIKVEGSLQLLILNEHQYLSGVWLGVDLRAHTKRTHASKGLDNCVYSLLDILGYESTCYRIRDPIWSLIKRENLDFDPE